MVAINSIIAALTVASLASAAAIPHGGQSSGDNNGYPGQDSQGDQDGQGDHDGWGQGQGGHNGWGKPTPTETFPTPSFFPPTTIPSIHPSKFPKPGNFSFSSGWPKPHHPSTSGGPHNPHGNGGGWGNWGHWGNGGHW